MTSAFAEAGAAKVVILGKREVVLREARREVETTVEVARIETYGVDIADLKTCRKCCGSDRSVGRPDRQTLGTSPSPRRWSVRILTSGGCPLKSTSRELSISHIPFLPNRNDGASLVGVSEGSTQIDALAKIFSVYNSSKFAEAKMLKFLAAVNPVLFVATIHPGVVICYRSHARGRHEGGLARCLSIVCEIVYLERGSCFSALAFTV